MSDNLHQPFDETSLTIAGLIATMAQAFPDNVAITAPGRTSLTYHSVHTMLRSVRVALNELGIGRGDRVAVVLPNGPEMAVAFLGVAACATCAPLNPTLREQEMTFALESLGTKAVILQAGDHNTARNIARLLGIKIIELLPASKAGAGQFTLAGIPGAGVSDGYAEPDDVALVLHTSGTTSRPKTVLLTQRNLCASAYHIRDGLELVHTDRCLNVMPLFHIHGLIGALLSSLAAGASIACTPGFLAPQFFAWVDECQPTWYTAVPTMHQAILAQAAGGRAPLAPTTGGRASLGRAPLAPTIDKREIITRHPLRFIRSCSSALPPQVMAELENVFGAPVLEAYGMTEAAHQIASNPQPPRARKPGSVGLAAGPEVAIMDETGRLLSAGETGEIVIRGINVTPGYEHNAEANRTAFTEGWFHTGDQGYLDADGYLFITGRIKELINRGGEKISPREIDEALIDYPAVAQAVAFAMPHPQLGEDVAAAVVLRPGKTATEQDLRSFVAARLALFKVPRRIIFLKEIPKGPTGKLQRIGLAERLGVEAEEMVAQAEYAAPRSPIEATLAELWGGVLGVERVGIHDHFLQLGGDSVLATLLISRIREALQVAISPIEFFAAPTVADLALLIAERTAAQQETEMTALLAELDAMSDEEALRLLPGNGSLKRG